MSEAKELTANLGESVLVGGVHLGAQMYVQGDQLDKNAYMKAGESVACAFASDTVVRQISPKISTSTPAMEKVKRQFLPPVVSGGLYVGLNMLTKLDQSSPMYQFLLQAGSHAVGSYVYLPLRSAISGKSGY